MNLKEESEDEESPQASVLETPDEKEARKAKARVTDVAKAIRQLTMKEAQKDPVKDPLNKGTPCKHKIKAHRAINK